MISSLLLDPRPLSDPGTLPMADNPWSLPPAASANAAAFDSLYTFFWLMAGVCFVAVITAQAYFLIKYRRPAEGHRRTSAISHSGALEFIWSAIPTVGFLVLFAWGEILYVKQAVPPADAIDVRVTGQKWFWKIDYPGIHRDGLKNELIVPLGVPMRLTMTSTDVIHSFFIPAFRLKKDVIPGRYTVMWFEATQEGEFPLLCAEYCGEEHSSMVGRVVVVSAERFLDELAEREHHHPPESTLQYGARVYDRGGCASCHTLTGEARNGPSFKGLYGKTEVLSSGATQVVDDNYIRESLLEPNAKIVQGFGPQMPSFAGQFNDEQIAALIEFIKAQK